MRVLVIGATGMLGHAVHMTLSQEMDMEVTSTTRRPLSALPLDPSRFFERGKVLEGVDVTDHRSVVDVLHAIEPDAVVNCAGIVKQREEASNAEASIEVNALFPHRLARASADLGARLVHVSTDCVFSGRQGRYVEGDVSDATDLYGRTKLLGEVLAPRSVTLRTSMIGHELDHFGSLLEWFLRQHGKVRGYTHAIFTGPTVPRLAATVGAVLSAHPGLEGLYHVAAAPISKFDLLKALAERFERDDVDVIPDSSLICDRSLVGTRFVEATGIEMPSWDEMVDELATRSGWYEGVRT